MLMQMTKMLWIAKAGSSLLAEINSPPNYKGSSCKGALVLCCIGYLNKENA
jgi:hypothetical protein